MAPQQYPCETENFESPVPWGSQYFGETQAKCPEGPLIRRPGKFPEGRTDRTKI